MDKLNLKHIFLAGGVIALTFFLLFTAWKISTKPKTSQKNEIKISQNDWVQGAKSDSVVLVEYSDFQCPACRVYFPIINQLNEKYKKSLKFVYRHFPLSQHSNSHAAAQAAEAAGAQDKFFELHDLLFEKQDEWAEKSNAYEIFEGYAKSLKLDLKKFKKDFASSEIVDKVKKDEESGMTFGVNSTPTFFLNGVKLDSPQNLSEFEKLITDELNKKTK